MSEPPKDPLKDTPPVTTPEGDIVLKVEGLPQGDPKADQDLVQKYNALADLLKQQQEETKRLSKKLAKSVTEKDTIEKTGLLVQIKELNFKTDHLEKQSLEVVKAVAITLAESGKDIVITKRTEPVKFESKITVPDQHGKHIPWNQRISGEPVPTKP